jgi:hypothetical protein
MMSRTRNAPTVHAESCPSQRASLIFYELVYDLDELIVCDWI